MAASPAARAKREADKVAALAMRRQGMDVPAVAAVLGCSARKVRELTANESLEPLPATTPAKSKPRRRAPRAFKRRNEPEGRILKPILLDAPPRGGLGGFGVAPVTVSGAALGPSVPIGGHDERGRLKLSEQLIDLGTTAEHDARRYDSARNDESWDDLEVPDDARRMVVIREDGSRTAFDLADL